MVHGYANIFPIEDGEKYGCLVHRYYNEFGRSELRLSVSLDSKHLFYLYFFQINYFSGPMGWMNANFQQREPEECKKILLRSNNWVTQVVDFVMERGATLYTVARDNADEVQIIANTVEKSHAPFP